METKEKCEGCYYFTQGFSKYEGSCLKNAPVVNPNKPGLIFPKVCNVGWCGEWREAINEPPLPKEDFGISYSHDKMDSLKIQDPYSLPPSGSIILYSAPSKSALALLVNSLSSFLPINNSCRSTYSP